MVRSKFENNIRDVLSDRGQDLAIDFDGIPFTWGDAHTVASSVEQTIEDLGLVEGESVALLGRNRPAHFSALWGIFVSARCASMVHAFQPPGALAADLEENRWPVVFGERRDFTAEVIAAADAAGTVAYAFTDDAARPLDLVTRSDRPGSRANRKTSDAALQLLSSGTTGKPKRISLSRNAVDDMIERTRELFNMGGPAQGQAQFLVGPISSLGGASGALPAATLKQTLAIQEKFSPTGLLEMIRRHRPPFLGIPPAAWGMVLQLNPTREDLSSVKMVTCGSAPLDLNVRRRLTEEYGIPVTVAYGATEFAGVICGWGPDEMRFLDTKCGSAGRALAGMKIRVVSADSGEMLPVNEIGLVEALVPRVGPDWIRTNDLARLDEDGFLFLEGRADDAIIRGGFKVLPEEVAAILRTHPKVGDAALIGITDERVGTVPAAAIQKRPGAAPPTSRELEDFLRTKLPGYKIPVRFAIVDELPRTQSLKPRREGLRALFN